jgi:SIR2-like domain
LAQELAKECHLDWNEYVPLSTVAFYYESVFGRDNLNRFLRNRIARSDIPPSRTIELLVKIIGRLEDRGMHTLVVTTNYDRTLEDEYEQRVHKKPQVIIFRGATDPNELAANLHSGLGRYQKRPQDWQPDKNHLTHIYKMHGCISDDQDLRSLVITEEDYINFLTNSLSHDENKQILRYVRGRIALSTVIFVAYSLADWNFRVIYKATAEASRDNEACAVQHHELLYNGPRLEVESVKWQNLIEFWGKKKVVIMNVDAA